MREALDDVDDTLGAASALLLALKAARLHVVLRWAGPDDTAHAAS